jgi:hypothetical protein
LVSFVFNFGFRYEIDLPHQQKLTQRSPGALATAGEDAGATWRYR